MQRFLGLFLHELGMALRRKGLWIAYGLLFLFHTVLLFSPPPLGEMVEGEVISRSEAWSVAGRVLDDPALELRFATPVRAEQTLLARLGLIIAVQTACALSFQLFLLVLKVDLSVLGGLLGVQLAWFLPTLSLIALGTAGALAGAQTVMGAFLVGAVWLVQVMMKGWFDANARYLHLFRGVLVPGDPDLALNQCVLLAGSLALLFFSWVLLHRQERYI